MHLSVVILGSPPPPQHLHNDIYRSPMNKISPQNAAIASPPGAAVGSDEDYSHKVQ